MGANQRIPKIWEQVDSNTSAIATANSKIEQNKNDIALKANLKGANFSGYVSVGDDMDSPNPLIIKRVIDDQTKRSNLSIEFRMNDFTRFLGINTTGDLKWGSDADINGNGTYIPTDKECLVQGDNSTRSTNRSTLGANSITQSGFYRINPTSEGAISTGDATHILNFTNPTNVHYGFQIGSGANMTNDVFFRTKIANTWNNWCNIFNDKNCPVSKSNNGYFKFSNGLIIQWGTTGNYGGEFITTTFPIAFSTTCKVLVTPIYGNEATVKTHIFSPTISSITKTNFKHLVTYIVGTNPPVPVGGAYAQWVAIGY